MSKLSMKLSFHHLHQVLPMMQRVKLTLSNNLLTTTTYKAILQRKTSNDYVWQLYLNLLTSEPILESNLKWHQCKQTEKVNNVSNYFSTNKYTNKPEYTSSRLSFTSERSYTIPETYRIVRQLVWRVIDSIVLSKMKI